MTTENTFQIPTHNVEAVVKHFDKFNRRADKLGLPHASLTKIADVYHGRRERRDGVGRPVYIVRTYTQFALTAPVLAVEGGWDCVGVINHEHSESVIHWRPGFEGTEYRGTTNKCDHCNTIRRRQETLIVQAENGDRKQVGKNCAADFFGHDLNKVFAWFKSMTALVGFYSESEDWESGNTPRNTIRDVMEILPMTVAVIEKFGWMSGGKAFNDDTLTSTSSRVSHFLYTENKYLDAKEIEFKRSINATHRTTAEAAMEWAASIEDSVIDGQTSDYLHNLRIIARDEYFGEREFGITVSLVFAYQKAIDDLKRDESKWSSANSQHVGDIKKRQEFTVQVQRVHVIDGYYGTSWIHNMVDDSGNMLVWFCSSEDAVLETEKVYRVKATPKKHDEYRGVPQTSVNRVAVVEELAAA